MAKVAIVMGSDSDMPVMSKAADFLEEMGIDFEMTIISAHREPDIFFEWAKGAEERGVKVIIAGAGKAAHLPGMCAALFPMPVIGIPMKTSDLGGVDSLYSIVQMPAGVPVASVAINGGQNAGILAAQILASSDAGLLQKLKDYRTTMKESVVKKADKLDQVGYKDLQGLHYKIGILWRGHARSRWRSMPDIRKRVTPGKSQSDRVPGGRKQKRHQVHREQRRKYRNQS